MAQASNYYSILTGVQSVIAGLSLTDWNGNAVPVVVRKVPKFRQIVDVSNPPVIYVSRGKRPERVILQTFGDTVFVAYPVVISTIAPGNQDLNIHIDYYLEWRQQLRRAFQGPRLSGVDAVWDTNMFPDTLIDEAALNKNWDVTLLTVEFKTSEQRLLT